VPNCCRSRSNRSSVIVEICQKILTSQASPFEAEHSAIAPRLLEPTRINRATYNFLSVLHSNYGTISYRFRDKGQYLQNFPTPYTCNAPAGGFALEFCNGGWGSKKTRMTPLSECKKGVTMCDVYTQYRHWSDRRTDGQNWQNTIALCMRRHAGAR